MSSRSQADLCRDCRSEYGDCFTPCSTCERKPVELMASNVIAAETFIALVNTGAFEHGSAAGQCIEIIRMKGGTEEDFDSVIYKLLPFYVEAREIWRKRNAKRKD